MREHTTRAVFLSSSGWTLIGGHGVYVSENGCGSRGVGEIWGWEGRTGQDRVQGRMMSEISGRATFQVLLLDPGKHR